MKPSSFMKIVIVLSLILLVIIPDLKAGHPCAHILICCRENNAGIKFLVNGKWIEHHNYKDVEQVSDILQKIKDAGIKTVIVDMTNESQWEQYWDEFEPMVDNIQQVCRQKELQFFLFIGAAGDFAIWNEKAERIWKQWAQKPTYRRYGFGDDRPILLVFQPADMYWERYDKAPDSLKTYLSRFHIGTTQVNDPILPGVSDGWGYRNYSQSVDGKVRFASPNGGVGPESWYHVSESVWKDRVNWAQEAEHYSIYGSYDDTCDGIHWGIADTEGTDRTQNKYPEDQPHVYYDVLKEALTGSSSESGR